MGSRGARDVTRKGIGQPSYLHTRLTYRLDLLIRRRLWLRVTVGLLANACLGILLGPNLELVGRREADLIGNRLALYGQLFLALIGTAIIPLATSSIVLGISGTGGAETLKAVGVRLGFFVICTTLAAAALGVLIATSVRLRRGISLDQAGLPLGPSDPGALATFGAEAVAQETPPRSSVGHGFQHAHRAHQWRGVHCRLRKIKAERHS